MFKKTALFLTMALTLFIFSCDNTAKNNSELLPLAGISGNDAPSTPTADPGTITGVDAAPLTEDQKADAGSALSVLNDIFQNIPWDEISKGNLGELFNKDGMKISSRIVCTWKNGCGIRLLFTLDNYKVQTVDNTDVRVSGQIEVGLAYHSQYLIDQNIVLSVNTPDGSGLTYTGGLMDGKTVGFKNLEMAISISEINLGSPVTVTGTVLIDKIPLYMNSEILEFLMGFIS